MSEIPKTKLLRLLVSVFTFLSPFLMPYHFFMLYLIFSLPYLFEILSLFSPVLVTATILLIACITNLRTKISAQCSNNEAETEKHVEYSEEHPEEKIVKAVESSTLMLLQNNEQECIRRSKDETFTISSRKDFLEDGELERTVINARVFQELLVDEFEYIEKTEAKMVKPVCSEKTHTRRQSARNSEFAEYVLGRMSMGEKEWQNSLACKLIEEELDIVESCEVMDLLWEAHEEEKDMGNSRDEMNNVNEKKEKEIMGYYEDEEDKEEIDFDMCCLPVLKFPRGKKNTGVGGLRTSKLVKGIRWLRSAPKHSKKM